MGALPQAEQELDHTTLASDAVSAGTAVQLIAFSIGEMIYGVGITTVREIRAWTGVTPLPNTAPFVCGVINLRGTIVPIIDLRCRFGLGVTRPTKTHVTVVVAIGGRWAGLLVDAVSDILTVPNSDVHPVPDEYGGGQDTTLLSGIITHDEEMVGLVNLDCIFTGAVID